MKLVIQVRFYRENVSIDSVSLDVESVLLFVSWTSIVNLVWFVAALLLKVLVESGVVSRQRGAKCVRETDCALPNICQVNRTAASLSLSCQKKPVAYDNWKICRPTKGIPGDCATQICHPTAKACAPPCLSDGDCDLGKCGETTVIGRKVKACDISCKKQADCRSGQICTVVISGTGLSLHCLKPVPTRKKKFGEACDPNQMVPGECENSFCSVLSRRCTAFCVADSDCTNKMVCKTTFVKLGQPNNFFAVKGCVPSTGSCTAESRHCYKKHVCQIQKAGTQIVASCTDTATPSGKSVGKACDPKKGFPGECASRICLPTQKVCSVLCEVDGDCDQTSPRKKCKAIKIAGKDMKACQP